VAIKSYLVFLSWQQNINLPPGIEDGAYFQVSCNEQKYIVIKPGGELPMHFLGDFFN